MPLLIVESPAKARKIQKYLGSAWVVKPCFGHVRDLPSRKEDIPAEYAHLPWAALGVDVTDHYRALYVDQHSQDTIRELRRAARDASGDVYLASDPDREGESIAWHLSQLLNIDPKSARRVTYHEITKDAIQHAVKTPRTVDMNLVHAQEARRIIDRLVGYGVSPLLWKAIGGQQSAGRVQSAALMLLAQREQSRLAFMSAAYWRINAQVDTDPPFQATVTHLRGVALASTSSYTPDGKLKSDLDVTELTDSQALALASDLTGVTALVKEISVTPFTRRPPAPFTTSSLQQTANSKLKLSVERITELAQSLYDEGFVTYIRTDSPALSEEALEFARQAVLDMFGPGELPEQPRQYAASQETAQEAHEAIRPAAPFLHPEDTELEGDQLALYSLIWHRTVASQMLDASGEKTTVILHAAQADLQASGTVIKCSGFLQLYEEQDDAEPPRLPELRQGQQVTLGMVKTEEKTTNPPARLGEGKFVALMEKAGIGRPSTYASTLDTLIRRGYVRVRNLQIHTTPLGFVNVMYLYQQLPLIVDARFTAQMEEDLDSVAQGNLKRDMYLDRVWKDRFVKLIAAAQTAPPRIRVPQLPGATLDVQDGAVSLYYQGRKQVLPDDLLLEDLTPEAAERVLNQTWKREGKKSSRKTPTAGDRKPRKKKPTTKAPT